MKAHILLIDDDRILRVMLAAALEKRGYEVLTASNGEQALKLVDQFKPDLIVSDIIMPEMDGWALIKQLRTSEELTSVPVIYLTALDSAVPPVIEQISFK